MGSIYSRCHLDSFDLALALLTLRSSNFLVLQFCVKRAMLLTLSAFVWALSVISFFLYGKWGDQWGVFPNPV